MRLDNSPYVKSQARSGTSSDPSPASTKVETLFGTLDYYLVACRVERKSSKTISSYRQRLEAFSVHRGPVDIRQVTAHDIRLFLIGLEDQGIGAATQNAYYRALHSFFGWLVNEGIISCSPMLTIKPPRMPRQMVKPLTVEQIQRVMLLLNVPETWIGSVRRSSFLQIRNKAIFLLFLDTGLRLSELSNIQLTDIDSENDTIIVMGKGSKERRVRMGELSHKAVLHYVMTRKDNYPCLWVTEERIPMKNWGVRETIQRLFKRAGITGVKVGPHTLRHTAAILFLRNGGGEFNLQTLLGHSTLSMTRRYVGALGEDDLKKAHEKASPVDNLNLR